MEVPTSQGRKWPRLGHLRKCFQLCVCESLSCLHAIWAYGLTCLNWVGCPIWIYTREQNWALVSTFTCTLRTHLKVYVRLGHSPGMLATNTLICHCLEGSDISECWLDSCWCCLSACRYVLSDGYRHACNMPETDNAKNQRLHHITCFE